MKERVQWSFNISTLAWECLVILQSELDNVAQEREMWGSLLKLLPLQPEHG